MGPLRRFATFFVVGVAALTMAPNEDVAADIGELRNPVLAEDVPDPFILRDGDAYYAYATNTARGNAPVWFSTDLTTWVPSGDALPAVGGWADVGFTWAPSVVRRGDTYVMFYSAAVHGLGRLCIGRAVSSSPTGPFSDPFPGPLVCQLDRGGDIDPSPLVDVDGSLYLTWKSEDNAGGDPKPTNLWVSRLSADATELVGPARIVLSQDAAWEAGSLEGPSMVRVDGQVYLFYAGGDWNSAGYGTGYATCDTPFGPCTKRTAGGPMMGSRGSAAGPGGAEVFTDSRGQTWLAYHAWTNGQVGWPWGQRSLRLDKVYFAGGFAWTDGPTDEPVVGFDTTRGIAAAGTGYWTADEAGHVVAKRGAPHLGQITSLLLTRPIVGMAATPSGDGYWLVASDGGIFAFGAARFHGSTGAIRLNRPIVGMAATPSGDGYWLVASDGGIFTFGDARFHGSTGALRLNQPIVGMAATPSGDGYWLVANDGGIFTFGDAPFFGAVPGNVWNSQPVAGITPDASGRGYTIVSAAGQLFSFGPR